MVNSTFKAFLTHIVTVSAVTLMTSTLSEGDIMFSRMKKESTKEKSTHLEEERE